MVPDSIVNKIKARIVKVDSGCWIWRGNTRGKGKKEYPQLRVKTPKGWKFLSVHRIMWAAYNGGTIPKGLVVCHRCDNPKCCNPEHLFLGTQQINCIDAVLKGHNGKLNKDEVQEIRRALTKGITQVEIAESYKVSQSTISKINQAKRWGWLKTQQHTT